jgi:hypothetical protein
MFGVVASELVLSRPSAICVGRLQGAAYKPVFSGPDRYLRARPHAKFAQDMLHVHLSSKRPSSVHTTDSRAGFMT